MQRFCIEKKIFYHDTDCGGVVYYANYLKYFEEGRSEYFLNRGVSLKELAGEGILFVVAHTELDYKSPARYQDVIQVYTEIEKIGHCSLNFIQEAVKDGKTMVKAKTVLVCIDKEISPIALPGNVKEKLQ